MWPKFKLKWEKYNLEHILNFRYLISFVFIVNKLLIFKEKIKFYKKKDWTFPNPYSNTF